MADSSDVLTMRVRTRPWYRWVLRLVAVLWLLFWLDTAVGSHLEAEPRALWISIVVLGLSVGAWVGVVLVERFRGRRSALSTSEGD